MESRKGKKIPQFLDSLAQNIVFIFIHLHSYSRLMQINNKNIEHKFILDWYHWQIGNIIFITMYKFQKIIK